MATFAKILEDKLIVPVRIPLPYGSFPERKLYAYPECLKWMKEVVPTLRTGRKQSHYTPKEQMILRLQQWISGASIKEGPMFAEMVHPRGNDVWELKTDDLRLFGWMYKPKQFIIAAHGYADDYKKQTKIRNYADDVRQVMAARDALPLDGPKFVKGTFHDLV